MSDIASWIYPAGVLVGWFVLPAFILRAMVTAIGHVDSADRGFAVALAVPLAFFWPLAAVVIPAYLLTSRSRVVREQSLREREERIARLERELGVDR